MFADCSANWDALEIMQRAAGGMINQIGIWTEQPLWKANGASEQYNLNLVKGLNDVAWGLRSRTSRSRSSFPPILPIRGRIRLRASD